MANLQEFTTYKNTLMQAICTSNQIVSLLKLQNDPQNIEGKDMRYTRIFPYPHVPLVQQQATTYICFSVTCPRANSGFISTMKLTIWVFTHQDLMRTVNGMRTDLLASEIDKILNGSERYGLGKVELQSCTLMDVPAEGYSGLCSVYTVKDFNRSTCGT